MNSDDFRELVLKNDQNELKKWLLSEGKKPSPTCPIFFIDDLDGEELEDYELKLRR